MPRGDGTGPLGFGPMTGRAAGYCAGYPTPGFMNGFFGRGFGRGGGFGRRNRFYATGLTGWQRAGIGGGYPYAPYAPDYNAPYPAAPTREQQIEALKGQAGYVESELQAIRKRIEALEAKTGEE